MTEINAAPARKMQNAENSASSAASAKDGMGANERSEHLQEAQGAATFYDFAASLFLNAIDGPGTDFVTALAPRTLALAEPLAATGAPGATELVAWAEAVRANEAASCKEVLAETQRRLAADRTFLFRAPTPAAPIPPYESYHLAGSASHAAPSPALGRAYAEAGVHVAASQVERDDYLGCELAFAAYLARAETAALEQGDDGEAERLSAQREAFEADHLSTWAARWCATAAPKAQTDFFRGFLTLLEALLD